MAKKLTIEFIRAEFKKEGYILLTKVYINSAQKLDYICSKGHEYNVSWKMWKRGHKCPFCYSKRHRITVPFIKDEFEKEGYTLLTKNYVNNKQLLSYICPNKHKHSISWSNWKKGRRCVYCLGKVKLTIGFIRITFGMEGYTLLTKEYTNSTSKLDYICPKGHQHSITWNSWQSGQRCFYCNGSEKLTLSFISSEFEKEGYKLLTTEYINSKQKLNYICSEGHKHCICWSSWNSGSRCPYCAGNKKQTIGFIRSKFEKEGYTLLTEEYKNAHQKLDYICPKRHKHSISWFNWQTGHRCPYCSGVTKPDILYIKFEFKKEQYILLTREYINNKQKLNYICPKGHRHHVSWHSWNAGHRCPECAILNNCGEGNPNWKGGTSKEPYCQDWTKDLKDFVKERDGHRCMNPDCWKKDDVLTVHHINYNKKVCGPENLITVCRSCNARANFNRKWHEAWYKAILHRRYGYNYGG